MHEICEEYVDTCYNIIQSQNFDSSIKKNFKAKYFEFDNNSILAEAVNQISKHII